MGMKKILIAFNLLFLLNHAGFSQTGLVKRFIINDKVELLLPKDFTNKNELPKNLLNHDIIMADKTGEIELVYNMASDTITDNDIPAYTDVLINEMKTNKKDYNFLDDGIYLQDGKNIGYIKFVSKEKNIIFNYLFYLSVDGKLCIFSFTCPDKLRKKWEPVVDEIANSLRIVQ